MVSLLPPEIDGGTIKYKYSLVFPFWKGALRCLRRSRFIGRHNEMSYFRENKWKDFIENIIKGRTGTINKHKYKYAVSDREKDITSSLFTLVSNRKERGSSSANDITKLIHRVHGK